MNLGVSTQDYADQKSLPAVTPSLKASQSKYSKLLILNEPYFLPFLIQAGLTGFRLTLNPAPSMIA